MSVDLPSAPPLEKNPTPSAEDINSALEQLTFGALDAIRIARQKAEVYTQEDLRLAALEPNDFGNGMRLRARFGDRLFYIAEVGWHGWTGTHWSREKGDVIARKLADDTHTLIFQEARALAEAGAWPKENPEDFEKRVGRHLALAVISGNVNKRNAMLESAASYLTRTVEETDPDPYLFNCANGTLDLMADTRPRKKKRDGEVDSVRFRKHDARDFITCLSPVDYDPKALCPKWRLFLDQVLPDKDVQLFMQQWAGLSLTGDTSAQSLVLEYGTGANGKSTMDDVIRYILGDYAKIIGFTSLLRDDKRRGAEASPDLARLRGARAAFASEPEHSVKFSEGLIKSLTGGEPITARYLNKNFFEYLPRFKMWLAFNNKPTVQGTDTGIWRRLKLVPFTVTIPPEKRNPKLTEELKAEASGILNWMLDGYRHWREKGLVVPAAVKVATEEYQAESDHMRDFLADALEADPDSRVQGAVMFATYQRWCRANAVFAALQQTMFGKRMTQSYPKVKDGVMFYVGCRLKGRWADDGHHGGDGPPPDEGPPPYESI
ncbi:MAG: phage/plasmid primase, P4 family [Rhodospirillaceae bacterium]